VTPPDGTNAGHGSTHPKARAPRVCVSGIACNEGAPALFRGELKDLDSQYLNHGELPLPRAALPCCLWRAARICRALYVCADRASDCSRLQKPILLKGHERSITKVIYNRDGDLIFTASKDDKPSLWYSDSGERIGTYIGHGGAVWDIDVNGNQLVKSLSEIAVA
jgi:hypothetical protein